MMQMKPCLGRVALLYFFFLAFMILTVTTTYADVRSNHTVRVTVKVLVGKAGVGKSYIASHMGCATSTCPDGDPADSCTRAVHTCGQQHLWDTMGFNDFTPNEIDHVVDYNGSKIKLTGLSYPMWLLLEQMEQQQVTHVEFYWVHDSNNLLRVGDSSQLFMNITSKWGCGYTRVLNKYRHAAHAKNLKPGDITIEEGQTQDIKLTPAVPVCTIGLVTNWRELIISQDILAVRATIDVAKCEASKQHIEEYQRALIEYPEIEVPAPPVDDPLPQHTEQSCKHEVIERTCNGFRPFRRCRTHVLQKIDHECLKSLNSQVTLVIASNEQKHSEYSKRLQEIKEHNSKRLEAINKLHEAQTEFHPCLALVNFQQPQRMGL